MTSSATALADADARREAQRQRIEADRIKKPCPKCKGERLFPRGGHFRDHIRCFDCGSIFKRKKA